MTIQIDSREHRHAIIQIKRYFDRNGIQFFVSKLPCGDYQDLDNARFCIDRKKDLLELCQNVCQQHKRFTAELNEQFIKSHELEAKIKANLEKIQW